MKDITNDQKTIRKQLAYCLKYYKDKEGYYIPREQVQDFQYSLPGTLALKDIQYFCLVNNLDINTIYIEGYTSEDYDGYPECGITISTYHKQTDDEYFDSVCQAILPSEYQLEQYNTYLRLKKMFEQTKDN